MKSNDEFIVGKKYKTLTDRSGRVCLCIGKTSKGSPVMEYADDRVCKVSLPELWVEVKEPREFWIVGAFAYRSLEAAKTRANPFSPPLDVLHVREVIHGE